MVHGNNKDYLRKNQSQDMEIPFIGLQKVPFRKEKSVEEFISLVVDFEKEYTKIKRQKKALDFDDLEKYALELLENEKLRHKQLSSNHSFFP